MTPAIVTLWVFVQTIALPFGDLRVCETGGFHSKAECMAYSKQIIAPANEQSRVCKLEKGGVQA